MKKQRAGGRKAQKIDADLDVEVDHYEPSDSGDGLDDDDRNLLSKAPGRKVRKGEDEVLKVYSSDDDSSGDDEEEEGGDDELYGGGVGSDMDSDFEGKGEDDGLPDAKAWGSDRKQYYDTDYVDKDYLGFDDEEAANEEEKEADVIQRRLMSHLEGTDFTLGLLDTVEVKKKEAAKKREEPEFDIDEERVEMDLSKLSREEFIEIIRRKDPELFPIIDQCKVHLKYLREKVCPILSYVDNGSLESSKIIDFLRLQFRLILHYAVNVAFYVKMKQIGMRTSDHTVLKRIKSLNLLIKEMDDLRIRSGLECDKVIEMFNKGENIPLQKVESVPQEPEPTNRKERRKRKLDLLKRKEEFDRLLEKKRQKLAEAIETTFEDALVNQLPNKEPLVYSEEDSENETEEGEQDEENAALDPSNKRPITFEMLKNKGLTPRRKKENRNPRVKHRNKYKKALIRRKGQVREPRKEIKKYGGEISGINARVSKSIKLK